MATTSILGDIVGELVGDDGEVAVLMGPGVDPHAYSPTPRDVAALREADLVVANGLGLEESLRSALEATAEAGVAVLELAPQLDPLAAGTGSEDHDDHDDDHGQNDNDDDHDHDPLDPHIWFDPERMATGVELLAAELADVAPQVDEAEWRSRGAAYAAQLRTVDEELTAAFAAVPMDRRVLVTNHDSLGYLAARYDLEVVGTVVPGASTQAEADPQGLADLVTTVEEHGVEVVFADATDATRLAEQLADEVSGRSSARVEVVRIATDALGPPGSPTDRYLGFLRETGTTVADRLAAAS